MTTETVRGAQWTYLATFANAGLQVFVVAVLARLISPSAFGLVAMATLVLRFGQYFAQMGVAQAIVQRRELTALHVAAGFWASVLVGAAFWGLALLAAPLAADVFDSPRLTEVLSVIGALFLITGTSTTALGLLRRAMRFRAIAAVEVTTYALGYAVVGITLALSGAGVWSLVAASLSQAALASFLYNVIERPRVVPVLHWRPYGELLGFGSTVSVISFLEFLTGTLDTMVVGRLTGAHQLGIYSRGQTLTAMPMQFMSTSLTKVLLPPLARLQVETQRIGRAYLSVLTVFAGFGLPVALGMSAAAREVVGVLLGPRWMETVPVVRIVALGAVAAMLTHFGGVTLEATAHLRPKMIMRSCQLVFFAAALVALSPFGLAGYATAFAVSELGAHVAMTLWTAKTFDVAVKELRGAYLPGVVGGLLAWALLFAESAAGVAIGVPALAVLCVQMLSGLLILMFVSLRVADGRLYAVLSTRLAGVGHRTVIGRVLTLAGRVSGQGRKPAGVAE